MPILKRLPGLGYDIDKLEKYEVESLYAEFDDDLEAQIKSEFVADTTYLVDLRHSGGICPLCGHIGCRWLFKIRNKSGGTDIECGSECIVTHGLNVMGAKTAEMAKKFLEARIRKEIRKIELTAWHKGYEFKRDHIFHLLTALHSLQTDWSHKRSVNREAAAQVKAVYTLLRFYDRHGWLGTQKKWTKWCHAALFARAYYKDPECVPHPRPWGSPKAVEVDKTPVLSGPGGITTKLAPEELAVYCPAPSTEPVQPITPRAEPMPEAPDCSD
jgi:hypothetical protein